MATIVPNATPTNPLIFTNITEDTMLIISGISIIICLNFDRNCGAFSDWVKLAVKVVLTWIIISIIVNFVFFKKYIIKLYNKTIRERHNFE